MAKVSVTHQWADGSATCLEVSAQGQHPDLLDELVSRTVRLWQETCADAEADGE